MKNYIKKVISLATFCIVLLLFTIDTKAQGELQFNQVITTSRGSSGTVYTVPAGKVFKLETLSGSASSSSSWYLRSTGFSFSFSTSATNGMSFGNSPVWLKEGDVITWTQDFGATSTVYISGIEFNVVP